MPATTAACRCSNWSCRRRSTSTSTQLVAAARAGPGALSGRAASAAVRAHPGRCAARRRALRAVSGGQSVRGALLPAARAAALRRAPPARPRGAGGAAALLSPEPRAQDERTSSARLSARRYSAAFPRAPSRLQLCLLSVAGSDPLRTACAGRCASWRLQPWMRILGLAPVR